MSNTHQERMANNRHTKYVEIDAKDKTIRIVEKDKRGRIVCASEFSHFTSSLETMKQSTIAFGYEFHHGTDLISVYKSVGV